MKPSRVVIEAIGRRAAASGRSMEEEARRALTAAAGSEREAAAQRLAEACRRVGPLPGSSSLDDLRRDPTRDGESPTSCGQEKFALKPLWATPIGGVQRFGGGASNRASGASSANR